MAFRFSLEQVLVYRTQLEDRAKAEFGEIQSVVTRERMRLDQMQQDMYAQEDMLGRLSVTQTGERWIIETYMKGLRSDIEECLRSLTRFEKLLEEARIRLEACSKDKMVMEKLKEKHEKAYKFEELQKEQREFDEIASIRFKAPTY